MDRGSKGGINAIESNNLSKTNAIKDKNKNDIDETIRNRNFENNGSGYRTEGMNFYLFYFLLICFF